MRILTFLVDGQPRLGALVRNQVVDIAAVQAARAGGGSAIPDMRALIAAGPDVWAQLASDLDTAELSAFSQSLAETTRAAPVLPSKICAIGLNYLDHVLEGGRPIPKSPVLFAKLPSAVIGPGDTIRWEPALSDKMTGRRSWRWSSAGRLGACGLRTLTTMFSATPAPTT